MLIDYDLNQISDTELIVCVDENDVPEHFFVPIDRGVKNVLKDTLRATIEQLERLHAESTCRRFELSEKYASKECLNLTLNFEGLERIRSLFNSEGWEESSDVLNHLRNLSFYVGVFRDQAQKKIIGVRRATQFKGILGARNRIMRLVDDTLHVLPDDLFKIDYDFDFIVCDEVVYILRPSGFEYIAALHETAAEKAKEKTLELGQSISFIDFSGLAEYVSAHKKAARIVAGLSIRNDLNRISKDRIEEAANNTRVELENAENGKLKPVSGHEIGFLEILDNRRYTTSLTDDETLEPFVAMSRKRVS